MSYGAHDKSFASRFPKLKDVGMEYRWGGRLCLSWNNVHGFSELEPGLIAACCQLGIGVTKGSLLGLAAADKIAGKLSKGLEPLQAQQSDLRRLPKPLANLGANAFMRWKEIRRKTSFKLANSSASFWAYFMTLPAFTKTPLGA